MEKVKSSDVNAAFLANLRNAVDALLEFANADNQYSKVLKLVEASVNTEFAKAEDKITTQVNGIIQKYNDRETIIAGVSTDEKPQPGPYNNITTGKSCWMDIRQIGIRRVPDAMAWQLTLNEEEVPGTGMPEDMAFRLDSAIQAFRNKKLAEKIEKEKASAEKNNRGQ